MNRHYIFYFMISMFILLFSCSKKQQYAAKTILGNEPRKTSFWYYQSNFMLDRNSTDLRTDGLYFKIIDTDQFGDTYKTFRFYSEGVVISHVAYSTPEKLMQLRPTTEGNIHGYYQTKTDSIFFTTKVYYNHSPTFYTGEIYQDSILLHSINYKTRESDSEVYYFLKE